MQGIADATGWPHAIAGYADFTVDDMSGFPLMRAVRMQLHWHAIPAFRFAAVENLAAGQTLQRNVARLAEYGLTFELQVFTRQMGGAAELAAACAAVTFILQHAGMLEDLSKSGRAAWREGMRLLARQPNVVVKLSGLGTFIHRNDAVQITEVVGETVAMFDAERCLFGSNFPIEKLRTSYADRIGAYRAATAHLPAAEQDAIFRGTAARVYRLVAPPI